VFCKQPACYFESKRAWPISPISGTVRRQKYAPRPWEEGQGDGADKTDCGTGRRIIRLQYVLMDRNLNLPRSILWRLYRKLWCLSSPFLATQDIGNVLSCYGSGFTRLVAVMYTEHIVDQRRSDITSVTLCIMWHFRSLIAFLSLHFQLGSLVAWGLFGDQAGSSFYSS